MESRKINFWIRYLFPIFLAIFLGILIFMMAQFREPPGFEWYGLFWFVGSIFLMWESGWWLSKILDRQFPWRKGTFKRLSIQLVVTNLLGIIIFLGSYILLNWYETHVQGSLNALGILHVMVAVGEAFLIVQIINSVQIGYQLLQTWQAVQMEAEAYKKESIIARLESLRQGIDPQFLTNNFNALEKMIQDSPEKVGAYLKELSNNYRSNQDHLKDMLSNVQQTLKVKKNKEQVNGAKLISDVVKYKTRFLVRSGTRFVLIPVEDIVAFYKDEIVLLFTKEGKKYAVDGSLEELYSQVEPTYFFRINRQCIVHSRFLEEMRMDGNQMSIELKVGFPTPLSVSQRNVSAFKRWLNEVG